MEAVKMSRFLIIVVLSLSTLKMVVCDAPKDRHLCHEDVAVSYTEEVPRPLEEFGNFGKYFKDFGVSGGYKTVTKTRLEDELVCCPGYEKSDGGDCVLVQTTTESTTEESWTSTEETSTVSVLSVLIQNTMEGYLPYILYAVLAMGALVVIGATVCFFKNRKPRVESSVKFDAEMQNTLI